MIWEYTYVVAGTSGVKALVEALNEFGRAGWELVSTAAPDKMVGANALVAILKRARETLAPMPEGTEEGWYPDPADRYGDRHWDGDQWTRWVRDFEGGTRSEDEPLGRVIPTAR